MDLPGVTPFDPVAAGASQGALPQDNRDLDKTAFMELLVAQMANQDPLQPAANEEFVAQLANFSSLEQLENLNGNILAMIGLNQSNALLSQLTQSSSLIGQEVTWTDPETGVAQSGSVDSVRIEEGFAFLRIDGQDVPLAAVTEILPGGLADEPTTESEEATDGLDEDTAADSEILPASR